MNKCKKEIGYLVSGVALAFGIRLLASRLSPIKMESAKETNPSRYKDLEEYVAIQMKRLNIPGAALTVVEGNSIIHLQGIGRASPGGEAPTPTTPFMIGSLTKSITAMAVMQLAEACKIALDAPVQLYLPWFRLSDPDVSSSITVRHLLNQTSGLPTLPGMVNLADFDSSPDALERQVRELKTLRITRKPGTQCEYSNLNYNILGLIVQAVSGEPYAEYIQKYIFDPLGMKHSYSSKAEAKQNGLATGYRHWFSVPIPAGNLPVPVGSLPSGQHISCAEDLAHYLIAHLNGGRYGDVQVLSASGIEEIHRGAADFEMMGNYTARYGMGWLDIDIGQTKTYSHGGNVPDFASYAGLIPEKKLGLILLFNADPYGLPPVIGEVGLGALGLLAGQQPPPVGLEFIQWLMRFLPVIPLLQIAGVRTTLEQVENWRRDAAGIPHKGRLWWKHILKPLAIDLPLVVFPIYLIKQKLYGYLRQFNPDVAWISVICGGFAGTWAILRTCLMLKILGKSR